MKYLLTTLCALLACAHVGAQEMDGASSPNVAISSDTAELVKGNSAFAASLYGELGRQQGNLFFSPASISTALAMTYAGARGDTASEMATTLNFTLDQARLHPAMKAMLQGFNTSGEAHGYQLKVANALWAQQGFPFENDYMALVKDNYGAGLSLLDFAHAAEAARTTINTWVEEQTAHKITNLIPPGALGADARLVLTNAVYFKGSWTDAFKKEETRDEEFHLSTGQPVTTKLMHRTGNFSYYEEDGFQALEIPYKGDDLSMLVLLPRKAEDLSNFESNLTAEHLDEWIGKLHTEHDVRLTLPVFKVTAMFGLNETLSALGMRQAFSPASADFSGMDGKRDLYISKVLHKAYVDVNEEGTEAAAATAVVMVAAMARAMPHEPIVFKADHPFVFLIRDVHNGSILFMGRLSDPSQAQ